MSYSEHVQRGWREGEAFPLTTAFSKACDELLHHHYKGMRTAATARSQMKIMDMDLRAAGVLTLGEINDPLIRNLIDKWKAEELRPATINRRLGYFKIMGLDMKGFRVRNKMPLKWWLRPEEELKALDWLKQEEAFEPHAASLSLLIRWSTRTGLRIEESLRLTPGEFSFGDRPSVTVPGTKTVGSQATLAIGPDAADIAQEAMRVTRSGRLFPSTYMSYHRLWTRLRKALGWPINAEMRAMRRSAARRLSLNGMPTDYLRRYLRHSDIATTMGYLHLTGGFQTEEMRRWV